MSGSWTDPWYISLEAVSKLKVLTLTFSMPLPTSSGAAGLNRFVIFLGTLASLILFSWIFLITVCHMTRKNSWWEELAGDLVAQGFDVSSSCTESLFHPPTSVMHVYCWSAFNLCSAKKNRKISLTEGFFHSFLCKWVKWGETCCHMLCQM